MPKPISIKVKRKIRDLMKLKDLPENLRLHSNVRAKSWRKFLEKLPAEEAIEAKQLRKQISAKRKTVWKELNNAFPELQKEFPWLWGFVVFGGFSRGKREFKDVDLIAVVDQLAWKQDPRFNGMELNYATADFIAKTVKDYLNKTIKTAKCDVPQITFPNKISMFNTFEWLHKQHSVDYMDFVGSKDEKDWFYKSFFGLKKN